MQTDVIGLGTVVVDHLVVLPNSPDIDTKTIVLEDRFQVGGPVPTALVQLGRLGWRCAFAGTWAADPFGLMIEQDFEREALDCSMSAARKVSRTGFAHVWVDGATGQRTVACHRPPEGFAATSLDHDRLARTRLLHLDGWPAEATIEAASIVRQHGGKVVLDTGSPKPNMEELLCHVDVVNCPRRFINQFLETDDLKTGLEGMLDMGPTMVTVTDGANGAAIASRDGIWSRSAFSVDAVDTTGAGDVFCGGLIHGILSDWPADRILPFAMAAAAIKCRGIGNRDALSDVAGIEDLLQRENRKVAPGLVDELSGDTSTRLTSTRGF